MIKITIDDKQFEIANSYAELSLGQYIDIIKLNDSKIKLEGNAADIKVISLLSNKPDEISQLLWDFSLEDFNELVQHFAWVAETSVLDEFKAMKPLPHLTIDGKKYGILSEYNKMTLGEIVSFETIMKQEQSDLHRLDIAFGLLLRPMDDNNKILPFSQEVFDEVIKNKYKVRMTDIYATIAFFLSGEKAYTTKSTKRFSIQHQ